MMKGFTVVSVLQEKGGTRKTYTAAHLYPWLLTQGCNSTLVDIDISAGHLTLLYPDTVVSLQFNRDGVSQLRALVNERRNLILDFGANSSEAFYEHIDQEAKLAETIHQLGGRFTIITPLEDAPKGRFFASKYAEVFPTARVIAAIPLSKGQIPPSLPENIRADRSFNIPEIDGRLLAAYRNEFLTLDKMGKETTSRGMAARCALRTLYAQYERVRHYLLPE